MVDFSKETTVGVPAHDVEKISLLERRQNIIDAWEEYYKKDKLAGKPIIIARLFSFFLQLQPTLQRRLSKEEYEEIETYCKSKKINELMEATLLLLKELDVMDITKLDTRVVYDKTNAEAENIMKGM